MAASYDPVEKPRVAAAAVPVGDEPVEGVATAVEMTPAAVAAAPGGCRATRQELDQHLKDADYGEKAAAFACYFVRPDGGGAGAPLCVVCRRPIAAHDSSSAAAAAGTAAGAAGAADPNAETDPSAFPAGLQLAGPEGTTDRVTVPGSTSDILFPLAPIMFGFLMLLWFWKMGIAEIVPYILIYPVGIMGSGIFLLCRPQRTTIVIDAIGTAGAANNKDRMMAIELKRVAMPCVCPRRYHRTVADVLQVEAQGATVVLQCANIASGVTVFNGNTAEATREAKRWRSYLAGATVTAGSV